MAGFTMSSLSTQYVLAPIRAWSQGVTYNPTSLPVEMAFISGWGKPTVDDWNEASWAWTNTDLGYYAIQCLVGPENVGVVLSAGTYNVWVQITGDPEEPVISTGNLTIT